MGVLGVLIMPWSVTRIFAASVAIDPLDMLSELLWLTLAPLCIGMSVRKSSATVDSYVKQNKKPLGLTQNSCILAVVYVMTSGAKQKIMSTSSSDLTSCLIMAALVHLIYRVVGYTAATAAELPGKEWITIVLMSSQKSLPVCISVLSALPPDLRAHTGLMIVPCIMAHAAQLIIDSMLAVRWELPEQQESKAPLLATLPK